MVPAPSTLGSRGPLDFYVVRLPSRDAMPFEAVREVLSLVDAEIIAVVDLVVIERGTGTTLTTTEARALDPRHPLSAFATAVRPILTHSDLDVLAESLPASSCAAVFVVEQVWATVLDETLEASDCHVVRRGPIEHVPAQTATTLGAVSGRLGSPRLAADPTNFRQR